MKETKLYSLQGEYVERSKIEKTIYLGIIYFKRLTFGPIKINKEIVESLIFSKKFFAFKSFSSPND